MPKVLQRLQARLLHENNWPLIFSATAAGVGLLVFNPPAGKRKFWSDSQSGAENTLSVMTWNVLARQFTTYNQEFHRASGKLEDSSQTRARHTLAGQGIAASGSDIVLLQELGNEFFDDAWNMSAAGVLQKYEVFACRSKKDPSSPGTAILMKKGGRATAAVDHPVCLGGTADAGGSSKIATVLPVRFGSKELSVISAHFALRGEEKKYLTNLIGESIGSHGLILGGDFNAEPGASDGDSNLEKLEAETFLKDLNRAELPVGSKTGLSGDFAEQLCIDHFYISQDLEANFAQVLAVPETPWGGKITRPAKVKGASDHVPVVVRVSVVH